MKRHIHNITSLPSISRAISEARTEVFTGCVSNDTCRNNEEYLAQAEALGRWAAEE